MLQSTRHLVEEFVNSKNQLMHLSRVLCVKCSPQLLLLSLVRADEIGLLSVAHVHTICVCVIGYRNQNVPIFMGE